MATKYYGINDKWTDDDIENVIEIASEDGSVDSVKVNGLEYGGGGGGTPSISITINNTYGAAVGLGITPAAYNPNTDELAYYIKHSDKYYGDMAHIIIGSNNTEVVEIFLLTDPRPFTFWTDTGAITNISGGATATEYPDTITITDSCSFTITA